MKRPLYIGITTSYADGRISMSDNYLLAFLAQGAVPVLLQRDASSERIAFYRDAFDGFLFAGGVDVNPAYYGEQVQFDSVEIDDSRDAFELALFRAVYPTKKPILGICRGIQLINVALGGSLYQHLDHHHQSKFEGNTLVCPQKVRVLPETPLAALWQSETAMVNTYHHQAIKRVAAPLCVNAVAEDGCIEAVSDTTHPYLLAVQWHPEIAQATCPEHAAIFRSFLSACEKKRAEM
ncbi:peptidase C26 [Clostridium sp. CAG:448]|nr:peptidase C26 [Clostridium sp. CAG:448]